MNKAYRSIYSEKLGAFVAVAENVKARGKRSAGGQKSSRVVAGVLLMGSTMAFAAQGPEAPASTLPATQIQESIESEDSTNDKFKDKVEILVADTVTFEAGQNLEVERDGANIRYKMSDDVEFKNVNITEAVTIAGNTTINEGGITTNVINSDRITSNEVLVHHEGDTINVGETLNTGIRFKGDEGEATERKLGEELAVTGDENITTSSIDAGLQIAQNPDLKNINSVETQTINVGGGSFVVNRDGITVGGDTTINMGGNQITNVAAGVDQSDAVNVSQLNALEESVDNKLSAGWSLSTHSGERERAVERSGNVGHEDNVHLEGSHNIRLTHLASSDEGEGENDHELVFTLNDTLELGKVDEHGNPVGPQVLIGADGHSNGVAGITIPGMEDGQGQIQLGAGDITVQWHGAEGSNAAPQAIKVVERLMSGLNFSAGNYNEGDVDTLINRQLGERLEVLGEGWIETEVRDGKIYVSLADGFPVVERPGVGSEPEPEQPGDGGDTPAPDVEHDSVTVGDVVINKESGIDAGGTQIVGVGDGTEDDHAVNLGQLNDAKQELTDKGMSFADSEGNTLHKALGDTLQIAGANDNIRTEVNESKGILEIALNNNITVDSITINEGGPVIDANGINMNDNRITHVADGVDQNDAVNVGQLERATGNLQGQVNQIRHDVHRLDKRLSAGIAAAMAAANLPQAYLPGKSMMAISGGTWRGESGMAIGYSGISDNGKWLMKFSGNASSRGDYGGAVGVGYQW